MSVSSSSSYDERRTRYYNEGQTDAVSPSIPGPDGLDISDLQLLGNQSIEKKREN